MPNVNIIDTDVHLLQKTDDSDVRPFMGNPYDGQSGPLLPAPGWDPYEYGRVTPDNWDVAQYLSAMDQEKIDISVLFPTRAMLTSQIPKNGLPTGYSNRARDENLLAAYCRGYNNYVASICKQNPRLRGVAIAPWQNASAAVAEARRAVTELGLVGIALSSLGASENVGSPAFWPVYEEIERLNVPLLVHNPSCQGPAQDFRPDTFLFQDTVGGALETFHTCSALIYGGIPEKFPKLRIGVFNIGVGWIPFLMERMDKDFAGRSQEETPFLKQEPSKHITGGNWYFATTYDERSLPHVAATIGEDHLIFGSAYPDADSLFPNAVSTVLARRDISEQAKKKIFGDNAKTLFGWS